MADRMVKRLAEKSHGTMIEANEFVLDEVDFTGHEAGGGNTDFL